MPEHTGQCLCGDVKYAISADPAMSVVCHCKNCQRQAGSAFSTIWAVPKAAVTFSGTSAKCYEDKTSESGGVVERYFCGECGSPIYSGLSAQPDMMYIKTGTLDNADDFIPALHLWADSKQPWVDIPADIPTLAKQS